MVVENIRFDCWRINSLNQLDFKPIVNLFLVNTYFIISKKNGCFERLCVAGLTTQVILSTLMQLESLSQIVDYFPVAINQKIYLI